MVTSAFCTVPDTLAPRKDYTALSSRQKDSATLKDQFAGLNSAIGSTPPRSSVSLTICGVMIEHMPMIGSKNYRPPSLACLAQ
jgi:hypothetical protein